MVLPRPPPPGLSATSAKASGTVLVAGPPGRFRSGVSSATKRSRRAQAATRQPLRHASADAWSVAVTTTAMPLKGVSP